MAKIDVESITIDQLPMSENEYFEYKSSKIGNNFNSLADKLGKAVSGFANSGGGYFVIGIDDETGLADGGIPLTIIGRRPLRDWIDTMIHQLVEPVPHYSVKYIDDSPNRGFINQGSVVLVVAISESYAGPHMMAGSYYIRAGVHTVKAKHFIVEAIRAKRYQSKPKLTHLFRLKPGKEEVLQLGILALTSAAAINVSIWLSPLPLIMTGREKDFPIKIPVVEQSHPFFFDVSLFANSEESFGNNIKLKLEYSDITTNLYVEEINIGIVSTPPINIDSDPNKKIIKNLELIEKAISKATLINKNTTKYQIQPPAFNESVFEYIEKLIPELLLEMKQDLSDQPFIREFVILGKHWLYNTNPNNDVLAYYFENHSFLRNKLRILENFGLIHEITYNDIDRFVMSEQFANHLHS